MNGKYFKAEFDSNRQWQEMSDFVKTYAVVHWVEI